MKCSKNCDVLQKALSWRREIHVLYDVTVGDALEHSRPWHYVLLTSKIENIALQWDEIFSKELELDAIDKKKKNNRFK